MQVISVISTKGGVGKTTTAANLGGFLADAGLRVLLIDLDIQPTLSSYYSLVYRAPAGIYELLATNERTMAHLASRTIVERLDIVVSNDARGQLNTLLLHAPDGRFRLRNLLPAFRPHYDLLLVDTQGARSVLLEAAVLASDLALSPVTPEILAARELRRGTLQLFEDIASFRQLGITPPPLRLLINRTHAVSRDARQIKGALRKIFAEHESIRVLQTDVPAIEVYPRAATQGLPAHRVEIRRPTGRLAPAALDSQRALATELFPQWAERFARVDGRARDAQPA
ncbi:ParA family protein [Chitinimonas lacunae]|uniref:ParA family protein n=1 Tax=Chitinimonas lacunae TaxID=1963018 RepID=A0ABV8MTS4_9NEIS